jgi:NTE family protein
MRAIARHPDAVPVVRSSLCRAAHRLVVACTLGAAGAATLAATDALTTGPAAQRPRVGLVLGGGGARGAAHIGVLEVLERLHVPVDCVAGTSFGALIAGAWASGVTPAEMRRAMAQVQWDDLFEDYPDYADLDYRNKRQLQRYIPGIELGVGSGGVTTRPGVVGGQKIKLFINQLVHADRGERDIAELPLKISLVATDIGNAERVVFRSGPVTQAMRASMSVPGLLAPVDVDGRQLVDGGLVDNLPVAEVRERCDAQVVIAVNVGSPLLPAKSVRSAFTVTAQMVALLSAQNVTLSRRSLSESDVYLQPDLGDITAADFARFAAAADRGRAAADGAADRLAALAVDGDAWRRWQQARQVPERPLPIVDEVQVTGLDRVNPASVRRHLHQREGAPLDTAQLDQDLLSTFGDGWYENVDYELLTVHDRNVLRVLPIEKPWGPDYLRFAVALESTLSQGSTYGLRGAYQRTWLNRLGGEAIVSGEIGNRTALGGQWYQPLVSSQRWFFQADAGYRSEKRDIYEGSQRLATFDLRRLLAEFSLGANIWRTGQARLGWRIERAKASIVTGPQVSTSADVWRGPVLAIDLDRRNRLHFPTDGWFTQFEWFREQGGAFGRVALDTRAAVSVGSWVWGGRFAYVGSTSGELPVVEAGTLGGFLNLSAYARDQFVADTTRYVHLRGERIIGRLPFGLRGDMRLGLAIEGGWLGHSYTPDPGGALDSLTAYLGGETPIGPVFVGIGRSSTGSTNAYFVIGVP